MKTMRLNTRGRILFSVLIALLLMLVTFTFNTFVGLNDVNSDTQQVYEEVLVNSGDTIWDIAQRYMNNTTDTRYAVYMICQANDITADQLYAGEYIKIPADL